MSSKIIPLTEKPPIREVIETTAAALRNGELVVFPTETVYGLGVLASNADAVRRLITAKGRQAGHALPVAISGYGTLKKYVPNADIITERLARRCWPGPITLVTDTSSSESWMTGLPDVCRQAIMPLGSTGFRVPEQPIFLEILRRIGEPVVLTSANLTGEPPAVSAGEAKVGLGDRPDLILDAGPARYGTPSTVISVAENRIKILRDGAFSKEKIKQMTVKIILFVCTGNTCRSPMAEMICSQRLAKELHCGIGNLEANGYVVMSAGVATYTGSKASAAACEVMASRGLSLENHQSQPLGAKLLRFADKIYVMGRSHREAINAEWPDNADRVFVLRPDGEDICDPLGGDYTVYNACARQIESAIEARMEEIL